MNIKQIKKKINHARIVSEGFRLYKVRPGYFKEDGIFIRMAVLCYKKELQTCSIYKDYNRFGFIYRWKSPF